MGGEGGGRGWQEQHEVASAYQAEGTEDGYVGTWAFLSVAAHAALEAVDGAEDAGAGVEEFVGA